MDIESKSDIKSQYKLKKLCTYLEMLTQSAQKECVTAHPCAPRAPSPEKIGKDFKVKKFKMRFSDFRKWRAALIKTKKGN